MRLILAAIAAITLSSAAHAASGPSTATLAAPAQATSVVTEEGVWRCGGTNCTGMSSPMLRQAVAACSVVADGAGRVAAFAVPGHPFTDADLVRCNRHVK